MAASGSGEPETALKRAKAPVCPVRDVRVEPGEATRIPLDCDGLGSARVRIVKDPALGDLGTVGRRADAARYRAPDSAGRERLVVARRVDGRVWRTAVRIEVTSGARLDSPRCRDSRAISRYRGEVKLTVSCRGTDLERLRVATGPFSGELSDVEREGSGDRRALTATYEPDARFAGQDLVLVRAEGEEGANLVAGSLPVLPWRMRTIGDSVTAGFGFYGNGKPMTTLQFPDCKPPAVVTNACSSNSDEKGGYTGPPEWSADFGLANDVAWPAQFATGIQGGAVTAPDMFQNRAVTGSAPADWLPGGILDSQLEAVVAENPDLIALTLGANPLLSNILASLEGEECADTDNVTELLLCIEPLFEAQQVAARLQRVYETLLEAEDATVVVVQYHLAVPAANLFSTWQLEVLGDYLNGQIAFAVEQAQASVGADDAERLILVSSQVDPSAASPTTIPRFNLGLPPTEQTWSPPYDCGDGDFVDGPSHQSEPTQYEFEFDSPFEYCEGEEWIIGPDTGIHPNEAGHAQFAQALSNVAEQRGLVPRLP